MKKNKNDYNITYMKLLDNQTGVRNAELKYENIILRVNNKSISYVTAFVDGLKSILPSGTDIYINKLD